MANDTKGLNLQWLNALKMIMKNALYLELKRKYKQEKRLGIRYAKKYKETLTDKLNSSIVFINEGSK